MMKIKKEMAISKRGDTLRLAILEDGELAEIYIEKGGKKSIVGNIYVGKITTVLPGMSAAFVDIGMGKNALLYLQDVVFFDDGSEVKPTRIRKALKENEPIVVQVIKDPMQGKGARLTTYLSVAGRLMVYLPRGRKFGISRKLPEKERERLRRIASEIRPRHGSTIIRTAANRAKKSELEADLEYLVRQWKQIEMKIKNARPPKLVYQEPDIAIRVIRDALTRDFKSVIVDSVEEYRRIMDYLSIVAPDLKDRVRIFEGDGDLFEELRIEEGIRWALERKVALPSGGYLVIDEAEALTAIDVNTGSFTGNKSLEDTVLKTNLEAAVEIVRQLRLRDIGGIIVIDFIDMESQRNREKVLRTFEKELSRDRTKTQVVTLSPLGLVEMTRKNVTEGLSGVLGRVCPNCEGRGLLFKT